MNERGAPDSRHAHDRALHIGEKLFPRFAARCRIKLPRTAIVSLLMRLALYQPDIPQNTAAIIRLGACLGIPIDIVEPCGFLFSDAGFRRVGMDYLELAEVAHHASWEAFLAARSGRIILMTTKATQSYTRFSFAASDIVLLGRE